MTGNKLLEHCELSVTLKLKLPKIELLPKFNGNITKFSSF